MAAARVAARSADGTSGRADTAASSTAAEASPSLEIRDGFCSVEQAFRTSITTAIELAMQAGSSTHGSAGLPHEKVHKGAEW